MDIYLLRHGEAYAQTSTDEERELTPRGIADTEHVVTRFLRRVSMSDAVPARVRVLVSPLRRAQQTAALAATQFAESGIFTQTVFETCPLVSPAGDPDQVLDYLLAVSSAGGCGIDIATEDGNKSSGLASGELSETTAIMLVSHNPLLSDLLALLVAESGQVRRGLATSELAGIHCTIPAPGVGTLRFILSPGGEH